MKFNSITVRLLLLVTMAFVVAAVSVFVVADRQLTEIIDTSQNAMYAEKVEVIRETLSRVEVRLQKTGLVGAYIDEFQASVIKEFRETYYKEKDPVLYPYILDRTGRVIMHPVLQPGDLSLLEWEGTPQLLADGKGDFVAVYHGVTKWYNYEHFEPWDWVFGFVVPLDIKYHDARVLRNTLAMILVGITLVALLVLSLFLTRLTKPIVRLTEVSARIADGDLEQEIKFSSDDEVGRLSRSISRMQDAVREKVSDLADNNEKLRQSEDKFRNLVEASSDFIWEVNKEGIYIYASPQIEDMLGYRQDEMIGKSAFDLMPPGEGERMSKMFLTQLKGGKAIIMQEHVKIHKDGRHIVFETNGGPVFDTTEHVIGFRGVSRDISERIQIREMMIQTEKMISVGGLAAGMAHEINNPLGIIIQALQNIERRVSLELAANTKIAEECGTSIEKIQAYLKKRKVLLMIEDIREAGARAAKIVYNMLQFSRKSESSLQAASVPKLIDQTIELAANDYDLKNKFDFRQINIVKEYEADLPLVKLVVTEFEQVILNLLKNSAQAMAGYHVSGRKPTIIIRAYRDGTSVYIEVEDNGPGMDDDVRKRAFEPFFTTKGVGKGTGLGLSVSYMIISNNHNGSLGVSSVLGEGATFTITLPLG